MSSGPQAANTPNVYRWFHWDLQWRTCTVYPLGVGSGTWVDACEAVYTGNVSFFSPLLSPRSTLVQSASNHPTFGSRASGPIGESWWEEVGG
ncbi:hypothetical protein AAHC03_026231 [Spirometra sp. Aus1]